jgi:hypothetical protein
MLEKLKSKVEVIKKLDVKNRYLFSGVASLRNIEAFEEKYEVRLPEDFKLFITKVTKGIKDQMYGDAIFEETNFANYVADLDEESHNPYIEFPVTKRTKDGTHGFDYDELTNGSIWLAGTGCGNGYVLIVKGKAKGQVWQDELASNSEVIPSEKDFSHWIHSQLDKIISTLQ